MLIFRQSSKIDKIHRQIVKYNYKFGNSNVKLIIIIHFARKVQSSNLSFCEHIIQHFRLRGALKPFVKSTKINQNNRRNFLLYMEKLESLNSASIFFNFSFPPSFHPQHLSLSAVRFREIGIKRKPT